MSIMPSGSLGFQTSSTWQWRLSGSHTSTHEHSYLSLLSTQVYIHSDITLSGQKLKPPKYISTDGLVNEYGKDRNTTREGWDGSAGKGAYYDDLSLFPETPVVERRTNSQKSCSLTSTCTPWLLCATQTHMHTHKQINVNKSINEVRVRKMTHG